MPTIQELAQAVKKYTADVAAEEQERCVIMDDEHYQKLQAEIDFALAEQKKLLSSVCDSTEALAEAKQELIAEFKEQHIDTYDGVVAVKREENRVNANRLLHVFGGDMDMFMTLANITQKSLKDFASLDSNRHLKKEILGTIEKVGEKIVDLEIIPQP